MKLFEYETEHLRMIRRGLSECTVLLKKNGAFPLAAPGPIAAYGSGVRHTVRGGTGSGEVNSRFSINVEHGLTKAGFTVTTEEWLDAYDLKHEEARKAFIDGIKKEARKQHVNATLLGMGAVMPEPEYDLPLTAEGEAAIYVLSRISGEGSDRQVVKGDFLLTDTEVRDILALDKKFEKFMLVLNVGGPVDLTPVKDVGNILLLSQLGVEAGGVLAYILLGKENPSGKLTTTWAPAADYCPDIDFGDPDDTYYREGIFVGYRYFDTAGVKPMYPFGYGLSYTEFEYGTAEVSVEDSVVCAKVPVKNTGAFAGKESVQLYLSAPSGTLAKPEKELRAFAKTALLAPGEAETLTFSFNMKDAASYAPDKQAYLLEAGEYILKIGADSDKVTAVSVIEVPETVIIRQVKALFGDPGFEDKEYNSAAIGAAADIPTDLPRFTVAPADLPRFTVAAADLPQETVSYEIDEPLLPEIRALSDEQLAYLGLGLFNPKGGVISMIGSAGKNVAGAAGETTDRVPLLPTLVMADGPAGLRLTKQHYRDEKGIHALNQASIPDSIMVFMPGPLKFLLSLTGSGKKKAPKGAKVIEQYATAIPIGTAIAQSFNTDFAEICGDVVGAEMEHFGVHLWLAPALNIHRSIFCGRNFEYYSEDPFVSGKMAAAVTRGVQKHPGRTVTLKHFAANNQEKNRVNSNSHVSERAMREIYLKGFEICIRESRPGALMTSYNLLNGTHTMENAPLLQGFLRAECGYEGLIMTDWVVKGSSAVKNPKYAQVTSAGIANAGGGLMMPGSKDDYAVLLAALKDGTADRRQLQVNASRLLAAARELTK